MVPGGSRRTLICTAALIAATVLLRRATLASFVPGGGDDPFGSMIIEGDLDASHGMSLEITLGKSGDSSSMVITGNTQLAGELRVSVAPAIDPRTDYQPGDSFIVLRSATLSSGFFDNLPWDTPTYGDGDALPAGPLWVLRKKWLPDKKMWAAVLEVAEPKAP